MRRREELELGAGSRGDAPIACVTGWGGSVDRLTMGTATGSGSNRGRSRTSFSGSVPSAPEKATKAFFLTGLCAFPTGADALPELSAIVSD